MLARIPASIAFGLALVAAAPTGVTAQQPASPATTTAPAADSGFRWRAPSGETRTAASSGAAATGTAATAPAAAPRTPVAKVTSGSGTLPNGNGQVWREYDISPYTARVTSTNRPEQAIVDWVLRETGYETWHSNVVTVLSADAKALRVYHTPEVHAVVADVVDRFVQSQGETQNVQVRFVAIGGPSWRIRAQQMLRPVPVQTQGIQAWLIAREDAALLTAELRKRSDFRELSAPQMFIPSGQSGVVSLIRPRQYPADVVMRSDVWPGYEVKPAQFDEGMSLEISPLVSLDGRSLDAVLKVNIDQLERLQSLAVDVPSTVAPRQRTELQVPQISHLRLHDRFRWPREAVLVVSLGIVPLPSTTDAAPGGIRLPAVLGGGPDRGELLLFVDGKSGSVGVVPAAATATLPTAGAPATSIPALSTGTTVPAVSLPGTSIPGTSIPGTAIPGTSLPTTVGGIPTLPGRSTTPRY
jgi:hypothetical protein